MIGPPPQQYSWLPTPKLSTKLHIQWSEATISPPRQRWHKVTSPIFLCRMSQHHSHRPLVLQQTTKELLPLESFREGERFWERKWSRERDFLNFMFSRFLSSHIFEFDFFDLGLEGFDFLIWYPRFVTPPCKTSTPFPPRSQVLTVHFWVCLS